MNKKKKPTGTVMQTVLFPKEPDPCPGLVTEETFDEAMAYLRQHGGRRVVIDTETTGLSVARGDRLFSIALRAGGRGFYFPFRHVEGGNLDPARMNAIIEYMASVQTWVGHNLKYDMQILDVDGFPRPEVVEDTMLGAHLVNENEWSFKLEDLAARYVDDKAHEQATKLRDMLADHGLGKNGMYHLAPGFVAPYALQDVRLTDELRSFYLPHMEAQDLVGIWQGVGAYSKVVASMEALGVMLDMDRVHALLREAERRSMQIEEDIIGYAGYPINPRSPKQMQALLDVDTTARADMDREMAQMANQDGKRKEIIRSLLEYRQWDKARGSYYNVFEAMAVEGVLHCNFVIHGTVAGRPSCREPNLQAIPRGSDVYRVKEAFVARPGYVLASADYSQAEIRLATHYTKDPTLIERLTGGVNIHQATADELHIPYDAAKRINFSVIYGIGEEALAENLDISRTRARHYLRIYHAKHPGYKRLYDAAARYAELHGFIRMWTGRRRHFHPEYAPFHKASSNLIQGGVSEIMRLAMTALDEAGFRQLLQVHDQVLFEVPAESVREDIPRIIQIMEDFEFEVPIKVEVRVGERWSNMETWQPKPRRNNERSHQGRHPSRQRRKKRA